MLKYGRDTYGPKHTPLFVDGIDIHTHEPVKWIAPNGDRWILSNLASQQNLFRTLDGLTKITGDSKYKQAAMDAIKYAFENLRSDNGLLYWGHRAAYDALGDKIRPLAGNSHVLKSHCLYYELMWEVDPGVTKDFIESFWAAHILDWSNLDMNRIGWFNRPLSVSKGWNQEYKEGPVFFESWPHNAFINTGTDLFHAAAFLAKRTGEKQPLLWAKRLAYRYVETRHPSTGISSIVYNQGTWGNTNYQLLEDFEEHFFDPRTTRFPPLRFSRPLFPNPNIYPWISYFRVGEMLGSEGKEFCQWGLEELTAWGKASYRKRDNSFVPILTDGTSLEGYVFKTDGFLGSKGTVVSPCPATPLCFWAYSIAYRLTGDDFMWQMVRDIAQGNQLGEIGAQRGKNPNLNTHLNSPDPYLLLGLLELYQKSGKTEFLEMACRIGDNILDNRFHKGFFPLSKRHTYVSLPALEPLALLHLHSAVRSTTRSLPRVWPSLSCFTGPYRDRGFAADTHLIYTLTESNEPPVSLQEAAFRGNINEVWSLITLGVDANVEEMGSYWTALHRAAMRGHKGVVELLLAKGADINSGNFHIGTPLHYAAQNGHKKIVELLISKGADVNVTTHYGDTPLHSAVKACHKDIVELLVAKGADVNAKKEADLYARSNKGQTPLDIAATQSCKDIVELLFANGAEVNAKKENGDTPLHSAARAGHKDVVELLITKGAYINAKNNGGQTPVDVALERNHKEIVDLLVAKGAHVSSIHLAAYLGDAAKVKSFIEAGAKINGKPGQRRRTPLYWAVRKNHKDVAKLLIDKGADVSSVHLLYYVCMHGHKDLAELLIQKGADVNSRNWGETPLHYAVWNEDMDMAKLLVAHGAKCDIKDSGGWTAFRYAAAQGNRELVEFFVEKGADVSSFHMAACVGNLKRIRRFVEQRTDVDTEDELGWSPLHWAASTAQTEAAKFLISKGANIHAKTDGGSTPLYRAARAGDLELVELLISKGADVNAKSERGNTPLHSAAEGSRAVVELLIAKGASVNAKGHEGRTPLHCAAMAGNRDVVEMLLAKGADVNAKDSEGRTALWHAQQEGHTEIVELLRKHEAERKEQAAPKSAVPKSDLRHDIAITGISVLSRGLRDYTVPVVVNLENQGDWGGSFDVKLIDVTDGKEIGTTSVTLPALGGGGIDGNCDLTFTGEYSGDCLGAWLWCGGDVNADGYDDLLVCAVGWNAATGRVYLYYGEGKMDNKADMIFTGENVGDRLGGGDMCLGDLNNDGFDDVIIGARYFNNRGRVYIYWGGPDMDEKVDIIIDAEAGVTDSSFGHTIVVGDLNGDGHNDLVIGANKYDNCTGRAYLYFGGDTFDSVADKTFTGEGPNDVFSHQMALADVDGDGCDDLLVGTRFYPDMNTIKRGRAYLYFGDPGTTMDEICDVIFDGENNGDQFASAIDLFDIDKDGHADVIIGARLYGRTVGDPGRGKGYLYWGSSRATMDNVVDRVFDGEEGAGSNMGGDSVHCGYVNNDSYGDIIFSGYDYYRQSKQGRAYLYYGDTKTLMDTAYDLTFTGEVPGSLPMRVRVADFNGDNCGDVAIGGWGYPNRTCQGRVWLYYGGQPSLTAVTFNWDTARASKGKHILKAHIGPVTGEEDTADNTMTATVDVKAP